MYREGHVGAALLAYAPVGASVALAGYQNAAFVGAAVMVALSTVPDWDQRIPLVKHRGVTHTVLFAFAVGGALWAGTLFVADNLSLGERAAMASYGFFVGALSVIVHIAVDALTPAGVRPFWPLWRKRFSLGITRAGNPIANYTLLTMGVLASSVSFLVVVG